MEPIEVLLEDRMYIVEVAVSLPGLLTEPNYRGLLDTGAMCTLVSPGVIEDLQAPAYGKSHYISANGQLQETEKYILSVSLRFPAYNSPDNDAFFQTPVMLEILNLGNLNPRFDVILGMDFLSRFHIVLEADLALITGPSAAYPQGTGHWEDAQQQQP